MTRWAWGLWLLVIVISFGVLEGVAIYTGTPTLSQAVWRASEAFPLLPFLFGLLCGGLGVHFFWISNDSKYKYNGYTANLPGSLIEDISSTDEDDKRRISNG